LRIADFRSHALLCTGAFPSEPARPPRRLPLRFLFHRGSVAHRVVPRLVHQPAQVGDLHALRFAGGQRIHAQTAELAGNPLAIVLRFSARRGDLTEGIVVRCGEEEQRGASVR